MRSRRYKRTGVNKNITKLIQININLLEILKGCLIDNKWKNKQQSYSYINERILAVRMKIDRGYIINVGVFESDSGKEKIEIFYEKL